MGPGQATAQSIIEWQNCTGTLCGKIEKKGPLTFTLFFKDSHFQTDLSCILQGSFNRIVHLIPSKLWLVPNT